MITVFDLLLNSEKEHGDRIAVRDENISYTYTELLRRSLVIGESIETILNHTKNNLVFIISTKSSRALVALWSVIASGNYYACLDIDTSIERMSYLVEEMEPALIIDTTIGGLFEVFDKSVKVIRLDDFTDEIMLDDKSWEEKRKKAIFNKAISTDPLYMVFTSGSTGHPKAIIKNHQSVLAFSEDFVSEFNLLDSEHEIFGNQASLDYDVSAKDIYISVYLGASLVIIPGKLFLTPVKLSQFLDDNKITILIWAASAIKFIERFNCFGNCVPISLKKVFFSGEPMTTKCMEYWKKHLPGVELYNLYAPSEVTGNCLYYKYRGDEKLSHLPLDTTFRNSEVIFLNENGKISQNGEKGEAYIRGAFLAQGYYKDSEQTKSRFIQNPLHCLYPDIVYRTGDIFTVDDGFYIFNGRIDNQIKHMGHRIELEEIEACITKCYKKTDFCIVYDRDKENIVMLTQDDELDFKELLNELRRMIPKYMLPFKAVYIKNIPLNARGKIDRKSAYALYEEENKNVRGDN